MKYPSDHEVGLIAAVLGVGTLFIGTFLHPMNADPNVPVAAFTEYATDQYWIASHLLQLCGVVLLVTALVIFSRWFADGPATAWTSLIKMGATASLASATALQAVDGIALKFMVNDWAAAVGPEKTALFHATLAVRYIEVGLASMSSFLFGLTVVVYGVTLIVDQRLSRWLGGLAIASGSATTLAGVVTAYSGFSDAAMFINMPATVLLMVWVVALGIEVRRRPTPEA